MKNHINNESQKIIEANSRVWRKLKKTQAFQRKGSHINEIKNAADIEINNAMKNLATEAENFSNESSIFKNNPEDKVIDIIRLYTQSIQNIKNYETNMMNSFQNVTTYLNQTRNNRNKYPQEMEDSENNMRNIVQNQNSQHDTLSQEHEVHIRMC